MTWSCPILSSIFPSNEIQVRHGLQLVLESGHKRVGILDSASSRH